MLNFYRLRQNRIHKFRPKVEIFSESGPFILKTITDSEELIEALKLRYQVFHREMIGKTKPKGIDVDEFDFDCDHLIIKHKKTQQIFGTYRMNCSLFSRKFYSANEFHLRRILEHRGTKIELGRACIHQEFRRGIVISLLWKGIVQYMLATDASLLFGCASVKTQSPRQAALLYHHFGRQGHFEDALQCPPTLKYSMPGPDLWIQNLNRPLSLDEQSEVEELIPPLCRAYLKAGAKLGGEPAYDDSFRCIDFLTIVSRETLNEAHWRKYSSWQTPSSPTAEPQSVLSC